jgi:hypothetical protein
VDNLDTVIKPQPAPWEAADSFADVTLCQHATTRVIHKCPHMHRLGTSGTSNAADSTTFTTCGQSAMLHQAAHL